MAKKEAPKKSKKEIEAEKRSRLMKIILALLFVVIMVSAALTYLINPAPINSNNNTATIGFDSIVDALSLLPADAQYVRYVDLTANTDVRNWANTYLKGNLGNTTMLGAKELRKDALASYPFPTLGYTTETTQVIVLSDFGKGFDNATAPIKNVRGVPIREVVPGVYGFSQGTYPTFSGREEYVANAVIYASQASRSSSAYATYAELLNQVESINRSVRDARFAVVGDNVNASFGDRYYAGVAPINATAASYQLVVHLKEPLNESAQQRITGLLNNASTMFGLYDYRTNFTDKYLIVDAKGTVWDCLSDLLLNWQAVRDASSG